MSEIRRLESVPPTYDKVSGDLSELNLVTNKKLYCSDPADVPKRCLEYAGEVVEISTNKVKHLDCWNGTLQMDGIEHWKTIVSVMHDASPSVSEDSYLYTWLKNPPSYENVKKWCRTRDQLNAIGLKRGNESNKPTRVFKSLHNKNDSHQIEGIYEIDKCEDRSANALVEGLFKYKLIFELRNLMNIAR